jgi:uncharacterized protein (TIGR02246 family)
MRIIHGLGLAVAASGLLAADYASAAPISKAQTGHIAAEIKTVEARWNADIKARDPVKFAGYYTDATTMIDPFTAPLHSRAAIAAAMKTSFADPNFSLVFAADEVGVSADGAVAWSQGHCAETETDATTHAATTNLCNYVTVYRREPDGAWKAVEDIATPAPPPPKG